MGNDDEWGGIMDSTIPIKELFNVLVYLYKDEKKDYLGSNKPHDHIFVSIKKLEKWYEDITREYKKNLWWENV